MSVATFCECVSQDLSVYESVCAYECSAICVYAGHVMHGYVRMHMCVYEYICMYVCMCVCMYACLTSLASCLNE